MSEDIRLDILRDAILTSRLDGQTKDALADDLRYAQQINGDVNPALQGIKRIVISGVRRELLANERVMKAIDEHTRVCTAGGMPKTPKEFFMRIATQYPLLIVVVIAVLVRRFGVEWFFRLFGT